MWKCDAFGLDLERKESLTRTRLSAKSRSRPATPQWVGGRGRRGAADRRGANTRIISKWKSVFPFEVRAVENIKKQFRIFQHFCLSEFPFN